MAKKNGYWYLFKQAPLSIKASVIFVMLEIISEVVFSAANGEHFRGAFCVARVWLMLGILRGCPIRRWLLIIARIVNVILFFNVISSGVLGVDIGCALVCILITIPLLCPSANQWFSSGAPHLVNVLEHDARQRELQVENHRIIIKCPLCNREMRGIKEHLGRMVACPVCHSKFTVRPVHIVRPEPAEKKPANVDVGNTPPRKDPIAQSGTNRIHIERNAPRTVETKSGWAYEYSHDGHTDRPSRSLFDGVVKRPVFLVASIVVVVLIGILFGLAWCSRWEMTTTQRGVIIRTNRWTGTSYWTIPGDSRGWRPMEPKKESKPAKRPAASTPVVPPSTSTAVPRPSTVSGQTSANSVLPHSAQGDIDFSKLSDIDFSKLSDEELDRIEREALARIEREKPAPSVQPRSDQDFDIDVSAYSREELEQIAKTGELPDDERKNTAIIPKARPLTGNCAGGANAFDFSKASNAELASFVQELKKLTPEELKHLSFVLKPLSLEVQKRIDHEKAAAAQRAKRENTTTRIRSSPSDADAFLPPTDVSGTPRTVKQEGQRASAGGDDLNSLLD